jgi:sortase A
METEVRLPWPTEPALCLSCERWVGRARAIPAPAKAAAEPAPGADEPAPASHERRVPGRRRSPRPAPAERRRARELGPPPVPRFPSPDEVANEHDTTFDDDGFAATGVWDAPGYGGAQDGVDPGDPVAPTGERETRGASHPVASDGDAKSWTALSGDLDGDGHPPEASANGDAPTSLDEPTDAAGGRSSWTEDDDDDLGPPAPFFAPAHAPDVRDGVVAPVGGHSSASDAPAESPAGAPESLRPAPQAERTLPFWSVPSEPVQAKRRLSLRGVRRPRLGRPRLRRPTRAGLMRALPIVLLVVGGLLLVEGALTVLWKEPFSAIFTAQTQGALGDDLEKLERESAAQAARSRKEALRYQRRRAVSLNRETDISKPIGRLRVNRINLNEVVVQGTDEDVSLKKGPGHYTETPLPGQKGNWTVGIAGHRTTYGAPFRNINKLKKGDEIVFSVPYGRYTYEVNQTKIVDAGYTSAFVPKNDDQIVLTACHPLYSAAQRILVYGKLKKTEPRGAARGTGPS